MSLSFLCSNISSKVFSKQSADKVFTKHLSQMTQKDFANVLQVTRDVYAKKSGNVAKQRLHQIDDIVEKINMCKDKQFLDDVLDFIFRDKKPLLTSRKLNVLEKFLDCENSASQLYSPLYNSDFPIQNSISKFANKIIAFVDKYIVKKDNKKAFSTAKEHGYSTPRQMYKILEKVGKKSECDTAEFQEFVRYSPLESSLKEWKRLLIDESYKSMYKIYLDKQSPEMQKFGQRIQDKFGINFFNYELNSGRKIDYYRIEKELEAFQKLMGDKKAMPDVLKVSRFEPKYFQNNNVGGFCNINSRKISLPNFGFSETTLRHELTHHFDNKINLKWKKGKHLTQNQKKELRGAGVSEYLVKYANTKLVEAKAVFSEGDLTKYSDSMKKYMVDRGFPEELLDLKKLDFTDFLRKEFKIDEAILEETKKENGGIIPYKLARILDNINPLQENFNKTMYSARMQKYIVDNGCSEVLSEVKKLDFTDFLAKELNFNEKDCEKLKKIMGGRISYDSAQMIENTDKKIIQKTLSYFGEQYKYKDNTFTTILFRVKNLLSCQREVEEWNKMIKDNNPNNEKILKTIEDIKQEMLRIEEELQVELENNIIS